MYYGQLVVGLAVDCHSSWLSLPWLCWEFYFLFTVGCGWLPSFIVGLWLLKYPGLGCFLVAEAAVIIWVLMRSCFGHARAKNNSEFPYGLELCFIFCLGLSLVVFAFIIEP